MPMFQSIVNHTAKSPQLCPTVWPHRQQPTRLPCPWDSPGKNTGVGCHFLLQCMKVKPLSHVQLLETPWTAAYQAPPSMGFFQQEYWSGVPLPSLKQLFWGMSYRWLKGLVIPEIHFFLTKTSDIFRRPSHLNSYQSTTLEYKFGILAEFIHLLESYYVAH